MQEKMSTYVKRIRSHNHYYVVGVWNGQQIEKKRWSHHTKFDKKGKTIAISTRNAAEQFKQTRSFSDDVQRSMLANMYETTDFSVTVEKGKTRQSWRGEKRIKGARIPNNVTKFQWVCKGYLTRNGKYQEIVARSEQHNKGYPLSKARDEAFERFLMKLTQKATGEYRGGAEEGWKQFDKIDRFHEGVVYYQKT